MPLRRLLTTAICALALCATGQASAEIRIDNAWARATAPGLANGAVYFELRNTSMRGERLIGVSTERSARAELHETRSDGGNTRMIHTPVVRVPAQDELAFRPGGRHVMLMGLNGALVEGESFEIVLQFEKIGQVRVDVAVLAPTAMDAGAHHGNHDPHREHHY